MGLLMFKERAAGDKSPFKRNEWHVTDGPSIEKAGQPAIRTVARSPISREASREANQRLRAAAQQSTTRANRRIRERLNNRNDSAERLNRALEVELLEHTAESDRFEAARTLAREQRQLHTTLREQARILREAEEMELGSARYPFTTSSVDPSTQHREAGSSALHERTSIGDGQVTSRQPMLSSSERDWIEAGLRASNHQEAAASTAARPVTTHFAPARAYWEDVTDDEFRRLRMPQIQSSERRSQNHRSNNDTTNQRLSSSFLEFQVWQSRARQINASNRDGERSNPWRVASPDTERAILHELENQGIDSTRSRGVAPTAQQSAPTLGLSRATGLGDRVRSPSLEFLPLDAEENWNELRESIQQPDEDQPSAGSSFASDTASSILSRNRPHSSLTSSTAPGSRATSTDIQHDANCPEHERRLLMDNLRLMSAIRSGSAASHRTGGNTGSSLIDTDPESTLFDMINRGADIPDELWTFLGVESRDGLEGGPVRQLRTEERL